MHLYRVVQKGNKYKVQKVWGFLWFDVRIICAKYHNKTGPQGTFNNLEDATGYMNFVADYDKKKREDKKPKWVCVNSLTRL